MDKTVKLAFLTELNKNVVVSIAQIKELMQYLVTENIIATKGGKLVKMLGAKLISTDIQVVKIQ